MQIKTKEVRVAKCLSALKKIVQINFYYLKTFRTLIYNLKNKLHQ